MCMKTLFGIHNLLDAYIVYTKTYTLWSSFISLTCVKIVYEKYIQSTCITLVELGYK